MKVLSKCIAFAVILLGTYSTNGQTFSWALGLETDQDREEGKLTAVDVSGNSYVSGTYLSGQDLDPGPDEYAIILPPEITEASYVTKIDPEGHFEWARIFEGGNSNAKTIDVDQFGNVYLFGIYFGIMDADPGPDEALFVESWEGKPYLIKLNTEGDFVWGHDFEDGEEHYAKPQVIKVNNEGDILLTARFADGEMDVDPTAGVYEVGSGLTIHDGNNFITKMDTDGNFHTGIELVGYHPPGAELGDDRPAPRIRNGAIDEDGNVYICGYFETETDFDSGPGEHFITPTEGKVNSFILKLDADLNFVWVNHYESETGEEFYFTDIESVDLSTICLTGKFSGTSDVDLSAEETLLSSVGGRDAFIMSVNNLGELNWANSIGGEGSETANSICARSGNLYITGAASSASFDANPGVGTHVLTTEGSSDVYMLGLTLGGEFDWAVSVGGEWADQGVFIGVDNMNIVVVAGEYHNVVDFDFTAGEALLDAGELGRRFLTRFRPHCGEPAVYSETEIEHCGPYQAPGTGTIYTESGVVYDTLTSLISCADSIVTINLTVIESDIDVSVTVLDAALMSNQEGAIYQWVDCWNDFEPIDGATDQTFVVPTDGSYAVVVTDGECTDTSECVDFLHFSIAENAKNEVLVYPNPSNGYFEVNFGESPVNASIRLYSAQGQLIYQSTGIQDQVFPVGFDGALGVYWLEITNKGQSQMMKIIKTDH